MVGDAKRDDNQVTTLLGVSNADGITPVTLYVDPTTHRLLVSIIGNDVVDEEPTGAVNGTNPTFVLDNAAVPGSVRFYEGGVRKLLTTDFSLAGDGVTITMTYNPPESSYIRVDYTKA